MTETVLTPYNSRKFKKAQLAEMLVVAELRIMELEGRIQAGVVARAETKVKVPAVGVLSGQAKLDALMHIGMFQELSESQKAWLKKNGGKNWQSLVVERTASGLKVKFNFPSKTRGVLQGMLGVGAQKKGFVAKVQTRHVYVHCY